MKHVIILYKCRKKLNKYYKERTIDKEQDVYCVKTTEELEPKIQELTKKDILTIVLYEGKEERKLIRDYAKKFQKTDFVIILTNNEARKFNLKRNMKENLYYISRPPTIEELSLILKLILLNRQYRAQIDDLEKTLIAFENVSELGRKELMEAYKTMQAYEQTSEFSRKELMEANKLLKAWENVSEFTRREMMDLEKVANAFDQVLELSREEKVFYEKIMEAWERVIELARQEMIKTKEHLDRISKEKEMLEKALKERNKKIQELMKALGGKNGRE